MWVLYERWNQEELRKLDQAEADAEYDMKRLRRDRHAEVLVDTPTLFVTTFDPGPDGGVTLIIYVKEN